MSEKDEFDMEFDEEFLKDVNDEEDLYYTQRDTQKTDQVPSKRRRLESPTSSRQIHQPLSTRKHHLLDIFSNKIPPAPPQALKTPSPASKVPKYLSSKPSGKVLPLQKPSKTPQKFPRTPSNEKILQPRTPNQKNSLDSPRNRQISTEILQKTVVRKFPGPAGLLPDGLDPSAPPESLNHYLCLWDENDVNVTKKTSPEKMSEFCTQDTKKIFLEGAWIKMLDNLPPHFIEGYDIASINEADATKVPRLALVIQKINNSSANPRITFKDISGTMEGMMHRDVAIRYPDIMKTGVVLLLQDVGILATNQGFMTTRTIIFTNDNFIAAFSEKGIIARTPFLDAIMSGSYDEMRSKMAPKKEVSGKEVRKWGEDLGEKFNSQNDQRLINKSIESTDKSVKVINKPEKSIEDEDCIELSDSMSIDESKKSIVNDREKVKNNVNNSDDFCDEDFAFEDDLFDQIDTTQFDHLESQKDGGNGRVITTVAVIEHRREEEDKEEEKKEDKDMETSGFGDDLLNDTDSEDEYLSQIDLDAISKSAGINS